MYIPCIFYVLTNFWYKSFASAVAAALSNPGRRPFLQSAAKVNWDTTKTSPQISKHDKFIFLFSSGKILRFSVFSTRKSIVASKNIKIGEKFSINNISCKRSGQGISPMWWNKVIGKKAVRKYTKDQAIELAWKKFL